MLLHSSLTSRNRFFKPDHRRTRIFPLAFLTVAAVIALTLTSGLGTRAFAGDNKSQNSNQPNGNQPGGNQQRTSKPASVADRPSSDVARGKYLVEGVAMCGQCHTPRDSNGNLDRTRWLQGAPIVWLSPDHDPNWPLSAPRIGGTPPADDAEMVKLLTTGIWTTGARLRLPMPQFRLDRGDAEAVVAYLKSLTRQE
jgi:mono/diheme cytochrome c family protein